MVRQREINEYLSKKIRILSFYYAILVVLLHSYCVSRFSIDAQSNGFDGFVYIFQSFICHDLARCAIPTFFAISGFLFFAKVRTMQDVFKGMKKRFYSLTIPYFLANIAYTALEAIQRIVLNGESVAEFMSEMDSTAEFIFRSVFLFHYNMAGWYLFTLMLWIVLTPMLFLVLKNKNVSVLALLVFFMLGVFEPFHVPNEKNYTLFFFFLGAFLSVYGMHMIDYPIDRRKLWVPVLLLVLSQLLVAFFGFYTTMESIHAVRFAFEILISVAIWYLADLIIDKVTLKSYFKYSFPIYIWHPAILTYAKYFVERMGVTQYGGVLCLFCFVLFGIIASVIPIQVFHFMKRKLNPVYRLLTGGR